MEATWSDAALLVVTGKGGVGKTTVAAALARRAADAGRNVLLVDVDGSGGVARAFGRDDLGDDELVLSPADTTTGRGAVRARRIRPDHALVEYLEDHGMGRLAGRLATSGVVEVVATAAPGIPDLLVLGKVKQLVLAGGQDLVVLDTPASGHAVSFLLAARSLADSVSGGRIRRQADEVLTLLADHERTRVVLVTLPEETPVNEVVDTAYLLEDRVGLALAGVVVNGCDPEPPAVDAEALAGLPAAERAAVTSALAFGRARHARQDEQRARLTAALPLPQVALPLLPGTALRPEGIATLADALAGTLPAPAPDAALDAGPPAGGTDTPAPTGSTASDAHGHRGELRAVLDRTRLAVVCGPGGVGKTTTSAALALAAARTGRRVCVVTVDPARRLADALGLAALGNHPTPVTVPAPAPGAASGAEPGDQTGSLFALMLDAEATFDDLVRANAPSPEQAERILANRLYRTIAGSLSGTQEYMAMEKLHELATAPRAADGTPLAPFDLLVVDTPPTRHAVDVLTAPDRLTRLLDNRVFRTLMAPGRRGMRLAGAATQTVLRPIGAVIGSDVLADAVAFLQAFEGMEDGFRRRSREVRALLRDATTSWVAVTSPRAAAVAETTWLVERLRHEGLAPAAVVANRVHPRWSPLPEGPAGPRRAPGALDPALDAALAFARAADRAGAAHEAALLPLRRTVAPVPCVTVPMLVRDVHDLSALVEVADLLVGGGTPEATGPARSPRRRSSR